MSNPKVVVAPDSFKGSLTAVQAARAMAMGVLDADPEANVIQVPLADGGEGTLDALSSMFTKVEATVSGPLGSPVSADWGWDPSTRTALIEAAQAAGLGLIPRGARDPWGSTSSGVGELVLAALDAGAQTIYLALGGTGTNDAGAGMLSRLGVRFLDSSGQDVVPVPSEFGAVSSIDANGLDERLADVRIRLLLDVENPLLGPRGATFVYGPQKGVSDPAALDSSLQKLARVAEGPRASTSGLPGSGAAGGLGWAALHFLDAEALPGAQTISDLVGLPAALEGADLAITGEGSVDRQTLEGKTITSVVKLARQAGIPLAIFAGRILLGAQDLKRLGASQAIGLTDGEEPTEQDLEEAASNLRRAVGKYMRS